MHILHIYIHISVFSTYVYMGVAMVKTYKWAQYQVLMVSSDATLSVACSMTYVCTNPSVLCNIIILFSLSLLKLAC